VVNGGSESVNAGGVASGTVVSGGNQFVAQGGTVVGANVLAGGQESVYGSASGTTVSSGGQESLGGTDTGTTVNSGGREYVQAFATALGWTCRVCTQAPGLRGLKDQDQHTGAASITEAGLRTAAALSSRMAPGGRALRADTARHGPWHPTRALRLV
jgi:autotransporter passenger strand-loop-strand repeat protein